MRIKPFLLLTLGLALGPLSAGEPGDCFNQLTMEVATPHYDWADNLAGGPVKALFVTAAGDAFASCHNSTQMGARQVVEWAQRMDFSFEAVTGDYKLSLDKEEPILAHFADSNSFYAYRYDDVRRDAKAKELAAKLKQDYELYVFHYIAFKALDTESRKNILLHVLDGAGLVLIGTTDTGLPKMFKTPDYDLADAILRLDLNPGAEAALASARKGNSPLLGHNSAPIRAYTLKKGRVLQIARCPEPAFVSDTGTDYYRPEWTKFYQELKPDAKKRVDYRNSAPIPLWWGAFENLNGSFLRAMYYAAGRVPKVAVSCPDLANAPEFDFGRRKIALRLANQDKQSGVISYRVRNDENKLAASGDAAFSSDGVELEIPELPGGKYVIDIISKIDGKTDDFGIQAFSVKPVLDVAIEQEDNRVQDGKPIHAALKFSRPLKEAKITITLSDSPFDRVWFKQELVVDSNAALPLVLENWFLPNSAGILRVDISEGGRSVAHARKMLFRPAGNHLPDWVDLYWGSVSTPIHGLVTLWQQGWNGATSRLDGNRPSIQNYMAAGELCMPWGPLNNWYVWNQRQKRSVGYSLDPKTQETIPDWSNGDGSPSWWGATKEEKDAINAMPAGMENRPDCVREVVKLWLRHTRMFDYGTELINLGDETSPGYDLFYGKFAQRELQNFVKREFGAIEKLNAAWGRDYKSFDDIPLLSTGDAATKKLYPEGAAQRRFAERNYFDVHRTIGAEILKAAPRARYGSNSSAFLDEVDFPELTASFAHPQTELIELFRSMKPEILYVPLFGYGMKIAGYPNKKYWESAISGLGRGNMYFAMNVCADGGSLRVDFRDKHPNVTKARLLMQSGVGPPRPQPENRARRTRGPRIRPVPACEHARRRLRVQPDTHHQEALRVWAGERNRHRPFHDHGT